MGVGGQIHAPAALPRGKKHGTYWTGGRYGRVWKISTPPGLGPQTVQPVASRYSVWAIPAPLSLRQTSSKL
jgi:hypothetical protein